jgi:putative transposase
MAHTYANCLLHCVFSTKNRQRLLTDEIRARLWPFIGGIARSNGFTALEVGGYVDHAHMLIAVPTALPIAKAMQEIKGGSSKFINGTFSRHRFAWQEGYGAFSVSASAVDSTIAYIRDQEEHHRVRTFEEEYIAFLKKNGISYDERYVFG